VTDYLDLEELLNQWEDLIESDPQALLDEFLKARMPNASGRAIQLFRHQATELASIDGRLAGVAESTFDRRKGKAIDALNGVRDAMLTHAG